MYAFEKRSSNERWYSAKSTPCTDPSVLTTSSMYARRKANTSGSASAYARDVPITAAGGGEEAPVRVGDRVVDEDVVAQHRGVRERLRGGVRAMHSPLSPRPAPRRTRAPSATS